MRVTIPSNLIYDVLNAFFKFQNALKDLSMLNLHIFNISSDAGMEKYSLF